MSRFPYLLHNNRGILSHLSCNPNTKNSLHNCWPIVSPFPRGSSDSWTLWLLASNGLRSLEGERSHFWMHLRRASQLYIRNAISCYNILRSGVNSLSKREWLLYSDRWHKRSVRNWEKTVYSSLLFHFTLRNESASRTMRSFHKDICRHHDLHPFRKSFLYSSWVAVSTSLQWLESLL